MKKIGICACYDKRNYGSMLQAMATCLVIGRLGYEYEIIRYSRKKTAGFVIRSLGRTPEFIRYTLKKQRESRLIKKYPDIQLGIQLRNKCFDDFRDKTFVQLSPIYDTLNQLKRAARNYDVILVGSDQLWRPEGYTTGFYNLLFVPDDIPKVSYATSFGVNQIPKNKKKIACRFLERMDAISVREKRGAEIIYELTDRKVEVVVDPTMLLDRNEWLQIVPSKPVAGVSDGYIFCYLLGTNETHRKWVKQLSKSTSCRIVTIQHLDEFVESDIEFGDQKLYQVGPEEFINLIRYAAYVCTDSFHGTVFSVLNHKQFIVFERFQTNDKDSRNSRIDSLLEKTGLISRRMKCDSQNIEEIAKAEIDYKSTDSSLKEMRTSSLDYLKGVLEK